jgi:hypothetical protein
MDLGYLDMASDIQKFDNFYRHQNGTINLSLISCKVYSIHMAGMDLRYLYMASDIRYLHIRSQLLMGLEEVDPEI